MLGDALGQDLSRYVQNLGWQIDIVVPVPLSRQRMRERGYNQVGLVASPMASLADWTYLPQALQRIRETQSQVGMSAVERKQNVQDAFSANPRLVSGKRILIMDDVATTGATISSCAKALQDAGASLIYALTIARALPHHGLRSV
jgi:competence protein ComFC